MRCETKVQPLDAADAARQLLKRARERGGRWALWLVAGKPVYLRDFDGGCNVTRASEARLVGTYDERAQADGIALDVIETYREAITA